MCYLVEYIASTNINFNIFLMREDLELCVWNKQYLYPDPCGANSTSKYLVDMKEYTQLIVSHNILITAGLSFCGLKN